MVPRCASLVLKCSRFCCAATASFSPPVTWRNQSRVSRPAKSETTITPITASRRPLLASFTSGSRQELPAPAPIFADPAPRTHAVRRRHVRSSPDPPVGGVGHTGRPPRHWKHQRRDEGIVESGDRNDAKAVQGEETRLPDD